VLEVFCSFAGRFRDFAVGLDGAGEQTAAATVELVRNLLAEEQVRALLHVNRHQDELYFSKEGFDLLCNWLRLLTFWELYLAAGETLEGKRSPDEEIMELIIYLPALAAQSSYKLDEFAEKLARLAG
jgi:hypothetical protein